MISDKMYKRALCGIGIAFGCLAVGVFFWDGIPWTPFKVMVFSAVLAILSVAALFVMTLDRGHDHG